MSNGRTPKSIFAAAWKLLKLTTEQWLNDKAPQLGAARATVTNRFAVPMIPDVFSHLHSKNCR